MTLVKIKHAQFLYYEQVGTKTHKRTGEEVPMLATRFGRRGQVVDIPRDEDYQRGLKSGAFEDEAEVPSEESETEDDSEDDSEEVPMTHDDLVIWIRDDKPTASEVVAAAENNPEYATLLMAAEQEASGGQPRKSVMDPLRKIAG